MKRLTLIAMAAALAATTCAAQASGLAVARESKVSFADLNIDNEAGARVLIARIKTAAREVCGPAPDLRQLAANSEYRDCMKDAMDRAIAEVPSPLVAQLYGRMSFATN